MIPIGAPVTATLMGEKRNGYVLSIDRDNEMPYPYRVSTGTNIPLRYRCDEVKIRYDNPAPFTLWQLNVLAQEDANDDWIHEPQQLAPNHIHRYWMHSTFTVIRIKPIKPMIQYANPCPFTLWQLNALLDANACEPFTMDNADHWLGPDEIGYAWRYFASYSGSVN